MPYNLSSNQADRVRFDEMIERYADMCLRALTRDEALEQLPREYASLIWDSFEIGLEEGNEVDDIDEAKGRFFAAFPQAVRDWQAANWNDELTDELCQKETGYTTAITVLPAGQKDGLAYNATVVEIVVLDHDGDTIEYRLSSDAQDENWELGTIEDAAQRAIEHRDAVEDARVAYKLFEEHEVVEFTNLGQAIEAAQEQDPGPDYEGPSGWRRPWIEDDTGETVWEPD